jgi:2-oxo-4-hydroxy-4-carboxy--5-ureidoimidazoline (OHCU) decarboxylase
MAMYVLEIVVLVLSVSPWMIRTLYIQRGDRMASQLQPGIHDIWPLSERRRKIDELVRQHPQLARLKAKITIWGVITVLAWLFCCVLIVLMGDICVGSS